MSFVHQNKWNKTRSYSVVVETSYIIHIIFIFDHMRSPWKFSYLLPWRVVFLDHLPRCSKLPMFVLVLPHIIWTSFADCHGFIFKFFTRHCSCSSRHSTQHQAQELMPQLLKRFQLKYGNLYKEKQRS